MLGTVPDLVAREPVGTRLMPAPTAAAAVKLAARSSLMRWILAAAVALPFAFVMLLVALGGLGAEAVPLTSPGALRPGEAPAAYRMFVLRAGQTCAGITAPLLAAQLNTESGWNPNAVSPVGAQGLAQFMPGTWAGEGVDGDGDGIRDPFNPADAIASQASFMCKLLAAVSADRTMQGDPIDLALAAYNAGLGAVQKYRDVPPYQETRNYVRRIRSLIITYAAPTTSSAPVAMLRHRRTTP